MKPLLNWIVGAIGAFVVVASAASSITDTPAQPMPSPVASVINSTSSPSVVPSINITPSVATTTEPTPTSTSTPTLKSPLASVSPEAVTKPTVKATPVQVPPTQTTKTETNRCDPNYSGDCVPIASDVDCASGSGNGPAYVRGPVTVIGSDIYDLDRDGDGIGCEK